MGARPVPLLCRYGRQPRCDVCVRYTDGVLESAREIKPARLHAHPSAACQSQLPSSGPRGRRFKSCLPDLEGRESTRETVGSRPLPFTVSDCRAAGLWRQLSGSARGERDALPRKVCEYGGSRRWHGAKNAAVLGRFPRARKTHSVAVEVPGDSSWTPELRTCSHLLVCVDDAEPVGPERRGEPPRMPTKIESRNPAVATAGVTVNPDAAHVALPIQSHAPSRELANAERGAAVRAEEDRHTFVHRLPDLVVADRALHTELQA